MGVRLHESSERFRCVRAKPLYWRSCHLRTHFCMRTIDNRCLSCTASSPCGVLRLCGFSEPPLRYLTTGSISHINPFWFRRSIILQFIKYPPCLPHRSCNICHWDLYICTPRAACYALACTVHPVLTGENLYIWLQGPIFSSHLQFLGIHLMNGIWNEERKLFIFAIICKAWVKEG